MQNMKLALNNDNYYSDQANIDYMSVSQFKDLIGSQYHDSCEYTGVRRIQGSIPKKMSTSLLVGSYVDSYFEGTLDQFKEENPDIFKKTGDKGLKAEYVQAEDIIRKIESDDVFMEHMSGQKQIIMTGELFGVDWKIKMDSYRPGIAIDDMKVMKDMKPIWADTEDYRGYVDFIRYWGYDIQGAIYQAIVEKNTGIKLPFFICCATKEVPSDIEVIEIPQKYLDEALAFVEKNIEHAVHLKDATIEPVKCNNCAYCRAAKKISAPITLDDIIPSMMKKKSDGGNSEGAVTDPERGDADSLFDD